MLTMASGLTNNDMLTRSEMPSGVVETTAAMHVPFMKPVTSCN